MSYVNGISNSQQELSPITSSAATPAAHVTPFVETASDGSASSVEHADQTNLSSTGGIVAQVLAGSDTRSDKVASLQQAITDGTYSVSSSDVAGKIIQSLLE